MSRRLPLRQRLAGAGTHEGGITAIEGTIGVHIGAEVSPIDWLTGMSAVCTESPEFTPVEAVVSPRQWPQVIVAGITLLAPLVRPGPDE